MLKTSVAVMMLGLAGWGCEQSGDAAKGVADKAKETAGGAGKTLADAAGKATEAGKEAMGDAGKQMMESVVKPMESQVKEWGGKIDTLKAEAGKLNNADLNGLVGNVTKKFGDIQGFVTKAMGGDMSAINALKGDGAGWMTELKGLFEKAMAKLTELKGAAGH